MCATAWAEYTKDQQQYGYVSMDELVDALADGKTRLGYVLERVTSLASSRAGGLGDNSGEIRNIISRFTLDLQSSLERVIQVKKEEKDKAAQEALRGDPRFKEIPQEVREAFAKLGITVKTNMTGMVLPGFKGGRGTALEPFARWFFQDRDGKSGVLYRTKDILKARYGAQFFSDAGEAFGGAWWHVPSSTDLKAIYELIA